MWWPQQAQLQRYLKYVCLSQSFLSAKNSNLDQNRTNLSMVDLEAIFVAGVNASHVANLLKRDYSVKTTALKVHI